MYRERKEVLEDGYWLLVIGCLIIGLSVISFRLLPKAEQQRPKTGMKKGGYSHVE